MSSTSQKSLLPAHKTFVFPTGTRVESQHVPPFAIMASSSTFNPSVAPSAHSNHQFPSHQSSTQKLPGTSTRPRPQISIMSGHTKSSATPSSSSSHASKLGTAKKRKVNPSDASARNLAHSWEILGSAPRDRLVRLYQKYVNPLNDGKLHKTILARHNILDSTFRNVLGLRRNTVKVLDAIRAELVHVLESNPRMASALSAEILREPSPQTPPERINRDYTPEMDDEVDVMIPDELAAAMILNRPRRGARSTRNKRPAYTEEDARHDEVLHAIRTETPPSPMRVESPACDVSDMMRDVTEGPSSLKTIWSSPHRTQISKRRLFCDDSVVVQELHEAEHEQQDTSKKRKRYTFEEEPISKHIAAAFCDEYELYGGDEHFVISMDKKEMIQKFNRSPRHKRMRKALVPERAI